MRRGCRHKPATIVTQYDDILEMEITGPEYRNWWARGVCEYGNCTELNCPECGCNQGGWGPVACPCEDWKPWRAMRSQPVHAAVKPSVARHRSGRHRATARTR